MAKLAEIVDAFVGAGVLNITLNITSEGGDVAAALSAYQYLKGRPINLTTHNFGTVDSAAVIVFAAGAQRLCTPLGRFVIHEPFVRFMQPMDQNEVSLNERVSIVRQETNAMAEILSEATGKAQSTTKVWLRDHIVWTAQEALDNKLIHQIKSEVQSSNNVASIVGPTRQPDQATR